MSERQWTMVVTVLVALGGFALGWLAAVAWERWRDRVDRDQHILYLLIQQRAAEIENPDLRAVERAPGFGPEFN